MAGGHGRAFGGGHDCVVFCVRAPQQPLAAPRADGYLGLVGAGYGGVVEAVSGLIAGAATAKSICAETKKQPEGLLFLCLFLISVGLGGCGRCLVRLLPLDQRHGFGSRADACMAASALGLATQMRSRPAFLAW